MIKGVEKKPWASKTLWLNLMGVAGILVQSYTGFIIGPELQVMLLGVINVILRLITKEEITWS